MTCEELNGMLDRLMDGELTEEEQRALEQHGETCPDCAEAIRATLQMKALFAEMEPEADVPLAAQAKWRGAVREEARKAQRRKWTRWIGSAAAAVAVLVGVGLAVNGGLSPKQDASQALVEAAVESDAGADEVAPEVGLVETDGAREVAYEVAEANDAAYEAAQADMAVDTDNEISGDKAVAAEAFEAEEAYEADEVYEMEAADEPLPLALGETAEEAPVCAAVAQQSPACEMTLLVKDVEGACGVISELAADFEGTADVQAVEGGSANVYVELYGGEAADFLRAVAMLDASNGEPEVPEAPDEGSLLVLLVVNPLN